MMSSFDCEREQFINEYFMGDQALYEQSEIERMQDEEMLAEMMYSVYLNEEEIAEGDVFATGTTVIDNQMRKAA